MYVVENLERITSRYLRISLKTQYNLYQPDEMMVSWTAVSMTQDKLLIQLEFKDPLLISAFSDADLLSVEVGSNQIFISKESN